MQKTTLAKLVRQAALLILCALPLQAQAQIANDPLARLDRVFERWNRPDAPGCAVAVARAGQPVLARAYGSADLEHEIANTPATVFEAGSVSKQFTAAAIILLAQDGKLSLNDPVRKYVPEVPDYGTPITLLHLLNHTSGLRDWGAVAEIAGWPRGRRAHTHAHVLDIVSRQRALNYPPAAEYSYTNTGYNLLAVIVERVSGVSLAQFTRQRIFEPLGMSNTQWRDDYTRIVKGRAQAYEPRGNGYALDMPFENVHGNGGLLTTIGDLLIWNENLQTGKVGGANLLETLQKPGVLSNGRKINYASGLMLGSYNNKREVSHTGSTGGYRALLTRYPDDKMSVAVLCNAGNANPSAIGESIASIFLGPEPGPPERQIKAAAVADADLQSKAGSYRHFRTGNALRVTYSNGKLQSASNDLIPLSARLFQVGSTNRQFNFEPGPSGERRRLIETTAAGDTIYYQPVADFPANAQLSEFAGDYHSPDAEVTLTVAVEDGRLILRRRPDTRYILTPVYADAFSSPLGLIRFHRSADGQISELGVAMPRVFDLRATRQR